MKDQYQFIHFEQQFFPGRATTVWICRNNKSNISLGIVAWNGGWRQYCFYPEREMVFSSGCLADIQDFIRQLKEERK